MCDLILVQNILFFDYKWISLSEEVVVVFVEVEVVSEIVDAVSQLVEVVSEIVDGVSQLV